MTIVYNVEDSRRCEVSAGTSNWGGYTIIIASTLQLVLSADFMYHWAKAMITSKPVMINIEVPCFFSKARSAMNLVCSDPRDIEVMVIF